MPSGIKLKWTGKKMPGICTKRTMLTRRQKAASFIHKPIYSSEATVAEWERSGGGGEKSQRGKKNTLNLLNSTILTTPTFPPHYAPLRHNRHFLNILHTTLRCFVSPPIRGRMEGGGERERERPVSKESTAQLRGEKVREALCRLVNAVQPVWAHPPVCLCASLLCRCVCVQMCSSCVYASAHKCLCVCVCAAACMHVYILTGLINAAPPPLRCNANGATG